MFIDPRGIDPQINERVGAGLEVGVEQHQLNAWQGCKRLTAEAIQGTALALEGVHHVHGSDRLPASVLRVGNGVADHVLQEYLEHGAGLFVDEARDTLHTATTSETADGGLGDALDVVAKDLPVTLGAAFAETFTALATTRHIDWMLERV